MGGYTPLAISTLAQEVCAGTGDHLARLRVSGLCCLARQNLTILCFALAKEGLAAACYALGWLVGALDGACLFDL